MNDPLTDIDLTLDAPATVGILINFLSDQLMQKGFTEAVIGLSGGLDSAVGAALLAEAIGGKHVTALTMPADQSDPQSAIDAELVANTLGINFLTYPIGAIVNAVFDGAEPESPLRIGNAAARARMIRLFDYSHQHQALVVGTSNKSELLLGYGTWFGDLACSINPIGDLYKTQIRQIADFLSIPEKIITKPPSADLWAGQTDEDDLGFSYALVDRLLYLLVDCEYSPAQAVQKGFENDFVKHVTGMITGTQFKRALPTIAKVANRTVGIDLHLARDWHK